MPKSFGKSKLASFMLIAHGGGFSDGVICGRQLCVGRNGRPNTFFAKKEDVRRPAMKLTNSFSNSEGLRLIFRGASRACELDSSSVGGLMTNRSVM